MAAFLRLETQHLEGRGAAGNGQIKEACDGGPLVGDEQKDQRRNQDANQGLNLYFKPFGVPSRQSQA